MSDVTAFVWVMLIIQIGNALKYVHFMWPGIYPRRPRAVSPFEDACGLVGRVVFIIWALFLLTR